MGGVKMQATQLLKYKSCPSHKTRILNNIGNYLGVNPGTLNLNLPTQINALTSVHKITVSLNKQRFFVTLKHNNCLLYTHGYFKNPSNPREVTPQNYQKILINKNDMVDVYYQRGPLIISMQGKAMEPGKINQSIDVENTDSKKIIKARVVGYKQCTL